jgi:LPXTG-motif cell wall-anchored protein
MGFSPIFADWFNDFMDFTGQWYFWVPLIILLLLLIGAFIYLRMRRKDDQ